MNYYIKYFIENSTFFSLIVATLGIILYILKSWIISIKNKTHFNPTLTNIIQIALGVSSLISGLTLLICSFYPDSLKSVQNLQVSLFISGIALIYVSVASFNGQKTRQDPPGV